MTYFICFVYLFYLFCCYGTGSFGTVERGLWNNLLVVLKKLNETYSNKMTNIFLKEARLLHYLRHENIIELPAVCDNPAAIMLELWVFYEAIPRESLVSFLRQMSEIFSKEWVAIFLSGNYKWYTAVRYLYSLKK